LLENDDEDPMKGGFVGDDRIKIEVFFAIFSRFLWFFCGFLSFLVRISGGKINAECGRRVTE